jgi:uncharacterized protein (DUF1330 family)
MTDAAKPAYLMVQLKAKNLEETTQRYGQFARQTFAKYGGEMIAGTPNARVLEGSWDGNWAAILRFPNIAAAEAWYNSPEYTPLKELRINELSDHARVLLIE